MKKSLVVLQVIIFSVCLVILTMMGFLYTDEYKPEDVESLEVSGRQGNEIRTNTPITITSWNIGYGALGDNADFFMDGGSSVMTATTERTQENMAGISSIIGELRPDILLLQEVDKSATRSHFIDEFDLIRGSDYYSDGGYQSSFAYNYKCAFVPYPLPPIGRVYSGIGCISKYQMNEAERISLPLGNKWPKRACYIKRCLQVMRFPVNGSDKELVIINLHLEAYDDGDIKIAQTEALKEVIQKELDAGNYLVIGGDYNQVFGSTDISKYGLREGLWTPGYIDESEFDSRLSFYTDASVPTCRSLDRALDTAQDKSPESFQYYVIDGFIVSDDVEVQEVTTLSHEFQYSDHNPISVKLLLK